MTRNGIGAAKSSTRSTTGPLASMMSSWWFTIPAIRGLSRSRRRMVNSGVRIFRSIVCSGGSVNPRPPMYWSDEAWSPPTRGRMSLLKSVVLASTVRVASCPVTTQRFMPNSFASRVTGAASASGPVRAPGRVRCVAEA